MEAITTDIINTPENRDLLRKYLYKDFIKSGIDKHIAIQRVGTLMKKHDGNLFDNKGLAWSLGKRSFEYFCLMWLQDFFVPKDTNTSRPLAPVHYDIWKVLENIFIDHTHDKQEFILPRGIGKSTIIDTALTTFNHCYKLSTYTIVLANLEADAIEFVDKTKKALQTPYILHTFGTLVVPRNRTVNKLELELDNDTKVKAYSSQTSVRGTSYIAPNGIFRPTCVIADDYISESDILTDESKAKKYSRWQKEVEEAGDEATYRDGKLIKSATKFIVIGTPLAPGDYIDSIKKNPEYKVFHKAVVGFDVDDYFENHEHWQEFKRILYDSKRDDPLEAAKQYYYDNKAEMYYKTLWEGKYECYKLAMKYFDKRIAFMQELMCTSENIGDRWFKSNITQSKEDVEAHKFTKTMLTVDTAGVKNKDKKRSDSFAFAVGSLSNNGFKYIRNAHLRKFEEFNEYVEHVVALLKEFKDLTHVFIEKNTYNGLDVDDIKKRIEKDDELSSRNITFINEMQRRNKDEKISTIVSDVNNGRIIFCEERVEKEFLDQVMAFCGQKFSLHDDAADVLAELANRIDQIEVIVPIVLFDRSKIGF
ncbi:hypothetical protein Q8G35_12550 [Peribacillus simplex]|uniref:Terminase n=2 Tax=Peribacillus TaxID=2675229 RepID=A0AA90PCU9_9BACI|nr:MULTISPECIES: hypothetical protein [Peribacillus]MDP1419241.1 hypothetical protein [Peribacillus simplex]MDP1452121.1 hypothetical protein [Peribacillus frigoritolerans]